MAIPDITAEINAFRDAAYGEEVRSALIQLAQKLHGSITNELADMSEIWNTYEGTMDDDWSDLQDYWSAYQSTMNGAWNSYKQEVNNTLTGWDNNSKSFTNLDVNELFYKNMMYSRSYGATLYNPIFIDQSSTGRTSTKYPVVLKPGDIIKCNSDYEIFAVYYSKNGELVVESTWTSNRSVAKTGNNDMYYVYLTIRKKDDSTPFTNEDFNNILDPITVDILSNRVAHNISINQLENIRKAEKENIFNFNDFDDLFYKQAHYERSPSLFNPHYETSITYGEAILKYPLLVRPGSEITVNDNYRINFSYFDKNGTRVYSDTPISKTKTNATNKYLYGLLYVYKWDENINDKSTTRFTSNEKFTDIFISPSIEYIKNNIAYSFISIYEHCRYDYYIQKIDRFNPAFVDNDELLVKGAPNSSHGVWPLDVDTRQNRATFKYPINISSMIDYGLDNEDADIIECNDGFLVYGYNFNKDYSFVGGMYSDWSKIINISDLFGFSTRYLLLCFKKENENDFINETIEDVLTSNSVALVKRLILHGALIDDLSNKVETITNEINELPEMMAYKYSNIQPAIIHEYPRELVSNPVIEHTSAIHNTNDSVAKPSIFKNGNWFTITYGLNLDGNVDDFPRVSDTGCLALVYKKFELVNNEVQNATYGTICQKGSSYVAYDGTTKTFPGGCGLPSGINNNRQYFSSQYYGTHRYNGQNNFGPIPCCIDVNLGSDGTLSFGIIHELTLSVNGVVGRFDLTRINSDYYDYYIYWTTASPYKIDDTHWIYTQPVKNGLVYLSSSDGINFVYENTISLPFTPQCELMCANYSDFGIIFSCRVNSSSYFNNKAGTVVGMFNKDTGYVYRLYFLDGIYTRSYLIKSGSGYLLSYAHTSTRQVDVLRLSIYGNYDIRFWRWFSVYKNASWYTHIFDGNLRNDAAARTIYIAGGNGGGPVRNDNMQFMKINFPSNKPIFIGDLNTVY
ncbi:MAG: hypothetical protein J6U54_20410 [Clostridiales bacterium]|nr:hypothetical protein [Clostridiales bacterium]